MPKLKVFISMAFTGKDYHDLYKERETFSKLVKKHGMELVEQFIGYQFPEDFKSKSQDPSFIVGKDKNWIKESDVVIADLTKPSIGAYQEIVLAKELFNKKVYAIVPEKLKIHYWIRFYTDYFCDSIEDALKKIKKDFKQGNHRKFHKNQYDAIAREYRMMEETPVQKVVYDYELEEFLSKKNAKKIMVLHCASGHRARMAVKYGSVVVGSDLSEKQLQIARATEDEQQKGITYSVLDPYSNDFSEDAKEYLGYFDVVIGFFLLDHASTKTQLSKVCENVHSLLKNGGEFFAFVDSRTQNSASPSKYGALLDFEGRKVADGVQRRISIFQRGKEVLHFYNFYWCEKTLKSALKNAGFERSTFKIPHVSADLMMKYPRGFWREYQENPDQTCIIAKKVT